VPKTTAAVISKSANTRPNAGWLERQARDEESKRLYEQERLITWIGEAIAAALEDSGMTRAELARKLGTSRAYVTRVLQGSPNLTLRSLADLAWALGSRVSVSFAPLREGADTLDGPRWGPGHRSPRPTRSVKGPRRLATALPAVRERRG
jgi:DNA-binding transcriptional regulator YiaG